MHTYMYVHVHVHVQCTLYTRKNLSDITSVRFALATSCITHHYLMVLANYVT